MNIAVGLRLYPKAMCETTCARATVGGGDIDIGRYEECRADGLPY